MPGAANPPRVQEMLSRPAAHIYVQPHGRRAGVNPHTSGLAIDRFQLLRSWGWGGGFTADVLVVEEANYAICNSSGEQIWLLCE